MRSVGLMAILLLFVACKPVARGPVSDLEAVTDGNLTLGMVAAEANNGAQAYRLLVCRKSASYPKWMLEDNNRCRPALLDSQGSEVVFIHDDLERDFANKYAGYAKGFAVPVLIGVGAWAAVFGTGATKGLIPTKDGTGGILRWVNRGFVSKGTGFIGDQWGRVKTWAIFDNKVVNWVTKAPASTFGLFQKGAAYAIPNWVIVPTARLRLLHHLDQTGKFGQEAFRVGIRAEDAIAEQVKIVTNASNLHGLKEQERLLKGLKKVKDGEQAEHIKKLQGDLDKMHDVKKNADGKVTSSFLGNMEKWINTSLVSLDYFEGLPKLKRIEAYEKVIGDAGINQVDGKFNFDFADGQVTTLTAKAARKDDAPAGSIQAASRALFDSKAARKYTPFGVSYEGFKNLAIKGAAGIALVTMTDIDKSVWGYGDRQTSMHWSQVFSEGMQSDNQVKDLPALLKGFADFFGHMVNTQALALGK